MEITQHYESLLALFQKCGKQSGIKISTGHMDLKPIGATGDSQLQLAGGPLSLLADVSKGNMNGLAKTLGFAAGDMQILINPRETIKQSDPGNITRSTIELAYIATDRSKPNPKPDLLLGLHYDFTVEASGDPVAAHPVFHAQLTHKLVSLNDNLTKAGVNLSRMHHLPAVRMPTAHMCFTSVLLGVAADNFTTEQFSVFLKGVRKDSSFPQAKNALFSARHLKNGHRMRSCVWYGN